MSEPEKPKSRSRRTPAARKPAVRRELPVEQPIEAPDPVIAPIEKGIEGELVDPVAPLPKNVAWVLISAGAVGLAIPGVPGSPFLLIGVFALWPGNRDRVEKWRQGNPPKVLRGTMRQVNRFLDHWEKRYPTKPPER